MDWIALTISERESFIAARTRPSEICLAPGTPIARSLPATVSFLRFVFFKIPHCHLSCSAVIRPTRNSLLCRTLPTIASSKAAPPTGSRRLSTVFPPERTESSVVSPPKLTTNMPFAEKTSSPIPTASAIARSTIRTVFARAAE